MAYYTLQIFDQWKKAKNGCTRYFFSHNSHEIGHDIIKDPSMEYDTINHILYINYQIVMREEWTEKEESFYYRRVRREFHSLGWNYNDFILNLEKLWASGIKRYKFSVTLKKDGLPTREEIQTYEKIFQDIEKEQEYN